MSDNSKANNRRHCKMMTGLGYVGGLRNYATYLKRLEYSKAWNKRNLASIRAASNRYHDRMEAELGSRSSLMVPLYAIYHSAERLQKRKDRSNESRKALLRLQILRPNRTGRGQGGPITIK